MTDDELRQLFETQNSEFRELRKLFENQSSDLRGYIDASTADLHLHFDAVAERIEGKVQLLAEGLSISTRSWIDGPVRSKSGCAPVSMTRTRSFASSMRSSIGESRRSNEIYEA